LCAHDIAHVIAGCFNRNVVVKLGKTRKKVMKPGDSVGRYTERQGWHGQSQKERHEVHPVFKSGHDHLQVEERTMTVHPDQSCVAEDEVSLGSHLLKLMRLLLIIRCKEQDQCMSVKSNKTGDRRPRGYQKRLRIEKVKRSDHFRRIVSLRRTRAETARARCWRDPPSARYIEAQWDISWPLLPIRAEWFNVHLASSTSSRRRACSSARQLESRRVKGVK